MLVQRYTRLFLTEHRPVETGLNLTEEGIALVAVKQGNETVVRPSTGAANEVFAGFSLTRNSPPATFPWCGEGAVPGTLNLQLPRIPMASQILVKLNGAAATIVANAPANAGEVRLVGDVLTFHSDDEGANYTIQMQYEPTVSEARTIIGDAPIGGIAAGQMDQIGVITRGDVATTLFDASADFAGVMHPTLGADGRLTVGGAGTELKGVQIISAPTSENSALVVRVNV